jgi:hypothetical protein
LGHAASEIFANFHQVLEKIAQVYFAISSSVCYQTLVANVSHGNIYEHAPHRAEFMWQQ